MWLIDSDQTKQTIYTFTLALLKLSLVLAYIRDVLVKDQITPSNSNNLI